MNIKSLKILAAVIGGAACFPIVLMAADAPAIKSQTTTESGTPVATDSMGNPASRAATAPNSGSQAATANLTDPQILGAVAAIDKNEINAAKAAQKMKIGPEAMAYAKMLEEQHKMNEDKTKDLSKTLGIKQAKSPTSEQLTKNGKSELKMLKEKKGSDFEKAYIDAMVNGHTEALQLIDSQLMASAKDPAVKTFLTDVRGHVASHLEQGKRLQGASASRTE